jgi:head-tail adaptor
MALRRRGDGSRVRPGDMTREFILKQHTLTEDGQGGRTGAMAEVARIWANVIPLTATRALSYGMVMNSRPHELDAHWEEDAYTLTEDSILEDVVSGQVLYIHSVLDADLEHYRAKILCTEKR